MLSESSNPNLAMPSVVVADRGGSCSVGSSVGVPGFIAVESPNEDTSRGQPLPSVATPTPRVRNGGSVGGKAPTSALAFSSVGGDNPSSASSGMTASSSSHAHDSLAAASDGDDSKSRASSMSFLVPRVREGSQSSKVRRDAQHANGTKVKSGVSSVPTNRPDEYGGKLNGMSAHPPRPMLTEKQRHQRQQMLSESIAFQHGEDATTLCSSVADDSRHDHSSLGGSASAFSGGSERDSMTNSVGFSYEEDDGQDDGTDDGYEGLGSNAPIYYCGLFGIDGQPDDDFEKFYDDLSIDSQGGDRLDRERVARHKEKMKQMAFSLRKGTRGKKGHENKNSAVLGADGASVMTTDAQNICSPKIAKARIDMAYEKYLHTYKFDTVKTPTASNKAHSNVEMEPQRIDRRTKALVGKHSSRIVTSDDNDVAVATSTIPPFQGSPTMDSSTGSSNDSANEIHTCPMCSSKLLYLHRRVFLDDVSAAVTHDAHVASAAMVTAKATNSRVHDNVSACKVFGSTADDCLQCADKCPDSVQPTVKSFLQHIFASSSTTGKHRGTDDVAAKNNLVYGQNAKKNLYSNGNNFVDYEEKPVPPYCTECRSYIVAEVTKAELREEMLANLSEWIVDTNDEVGGAEGGEDNEFQIASLNVYEGGNVVVDRPLKGNILVLLDDERGDQVVRSSRDMDEQSVTTRQQENLSPGHVPIHVPTHLGLHLVSSSDVQARGREVLPPPPASIPSVSQDPAVSHAEQGDVYASPMFASLFGPPDASLPFSDALNNAARPKKETETVGSCGSNAIAEVSSVCQTPSIRTEDEQAEMIANYPTKRNIATNIIGAKLLKGYSLTHKQCFFCDMPMMERDKKCECVVCPVIKRKAKRRARDKRKERKKFPSVEAGDKSVPVVHQDDQISVFRGKAGETSQHTGTLGRIFPANADLSKVIQGDALLELIETPVQTYFDGLDTASDRLLNGWHLSDKRQGCSNCGHPTICRDSTLHGSQGICLNNSCRLVATDRSENDCRAPHVQLNNRSCECDNDDDLFDFDLDDPALVALQKLAFDFQNTTNETNNNTLQNAANTLDESSGRDSLVAPDEDERRRSIDYVFTFDREGLDDSRIDENCIESISGAGPDAEIHCDNLTSCSSLSFAGKKSYCSKKTCTTGIATSRSESSDASDDISALVEKMNRAKQRILSRVERRDTDLNNINGRANKKYRNTVDYDVANLIDRLALAAKEVEELDSCIAKAQEDQALNF